MATRTINNLTAGLAGDLDDTAQFAMANNDGLTRRYTVAQVRTALAAGTQLFTGDLTFTDATYDIGKTGATRPRDGHFSRNLVVGAGVYAVSHFYSSAGTGVAALSAPSTTQSVANAGVLNLNDILPFQGRHRGMLLVSVDNGPTGLFLLGQDNTTIDSANTALVFETVPNGVGFSQSAGTGSKHNIYYDSGDDRFELQNNSGGTREYRFTWLSNG